MITKRTEFGKIEILPDGQIQVREDTVIEEDGKELIRTYHRRVLEPTLTPAEPDARLSAVLPVLWTEKVVTDYEEAKRKRAAEFPIRVDSDTIKAVASSVPSKETP